MDKDIFGGKQNSLNDFSVNNKKYRSLEEMPSEVRMQMESKLRELQKAPFVNKMFTNGQLDPAKVNEFLKIAPFADKMFSNGQVDQHKMNELLKGTVTKGFGPSLTAIMLGIFLLTGGIIYAVFQIIQGTEETFELTTDPTRFDPVASFGEIKSHIAEDAQFLSFDARYVRPDGTMDLTADYRPSTEYSFYIELAEAPKNAPPVGAGGNPEGKWYQQVDADIYEPGQWRHVTSMGGGVSTEYSYQNKGIDLDRKTPTGKIYYDVAAAPECSLKNFWDEAIRHGAPKNAVASIDYDSTGYKFSINDAGIFLNFTTDCKVEK